VLHPYISQVKQLITFKDEVASRFCHSLHLLVRGGDPILSGLGWVIVVVGGALYATPR
jgi:hypothetical protein